MVSFIKKFINEKYKNVLQYSVPYKPKTNAIESWFSQFKHYFVLEKQSYTNYMKYAYKTYRK